MNYPRVSEILAPFYDGMTDGYYLRRGTWIGDCCDILAMGGDLDYDTAAYGGTPRLMPTGGVETWGAYVLRYQEWLTDALIQGPFVQCLAVQEESVNKTERIIGHSDQRWLMTDGREAIIDIKTGVVRQCVALQTAFYDLGTPINKRRRRFSIHLTADKATLTEWKDSRDYDNARILARAYHVMRDYR